VSFVVPHKEHQTMAIDAIGGSSSSSAVQGAGFASPREFRQTVLDSAAQVLGMSSQDVQTALQNGSSLADLAQQKGISKDQLVTAISQGIQSLSTTSGGLPGAPDPTQMAQRIVDRPGGLSGHRHHEGIGALLNGTDPDGDGTASGDATGSTDSTVSPFAVVAGALGMSQGDLLSALESGTSLTDLFSQQGVTLQSLGQGSVVDTTA
jgi:hypothetical protein